MPHSLHARGQPSSAVASASDLPPGARRRAGPGPPRWPPSPSEKPPALPSVPPSPSWRGRGLRTAPATSRRLRSWCHGAAVGQSGHLSAVTRRPVQFFPTSGEGTSVVDPHLGVWFPQLQRAGQTRGPSQQGTPSRRKAIWVGEATRVVSPTPVAAPSCHVALRTLPEDCRWPLRAAPPPGPPDSGGSGAGTQLDPWDAAPPKAWGARGTGPAWRQVRLQASGGGAALGRDAGRDRRRGRARPRGLV